MATKKEVSKGFTPNIRLIKGAEPITVEAEVNPGNRQAILLPSAKDQIKGWYHPRAGEIIRLYRDRYEAYTEDSKEAEADV